MYRRHRHPSCCNFDFSPAISVGGIYYGGDILYKYTEQGERIDDKAMDITSYRRFIQRTVHLFRMKDNSRALHHFKLAVDSTETQFNPNELLEATTLLVGGYVEQAFNASSTVFPKSAYRILGLHTCVV